MLLIHEEVDIGDRVKTIQLNRLLKILNPVCHQKHAPEVLYLGGFGLLRKKCRAEL